MEINTEIEKGALGNAIRKARIENKLSQEKLAEMVGITPTHLKHIESEHRKPSVEVLFQIALILHMSIDNIIFQQETFIQYRIKEIESLLNTCSINELQIILDLIRSIQNNRNTINSP